MTPWTTTAILRRINRLTLAELAAVMYGRNENWPCNACGEPAAYTADGNIWQCGACRIQGTVADYATTAVRDVHVIRHVMQEAA